MALEKDEAGTNRYGTGLANKLVGNSPLLAGLINVGMGAVPGVGPAFTAANAVSSALGGPNLGVQVAKELRYSTGQNEPAAAPTSTARSATPRATRPAGATPMSRIPAQEQYKGVPYSGTTDPADPTPNVTGSDMYAAEARKNMRAVLDDYDRQVKDIRARYQLSETPEERRMLAAQMNALGTQLNTAITNINATFNTARDYTAWAGGQANQYLTNAAGVSSKALRQTAKGTGGAYAQAIKGMGGQAAASGAATGGAMGAFGAQLAAMASQAGAGYAAQAQMSHDEQAALAQARYAEMVAERIANERAAQNAELAALAAGRLDYRRSVLSDIADRNYDWLKMEREAALSGAPGAAGAAPAGVPDDVMSSRVAAMTGRTQAYAPASPVVETVGLDGAPVQLPAMSYYQNMLGTAATATSPAEFRAGIAKLLMEDPNFALYVKNNNINFDQFYNDAWGR